VPLIIDGRPLLRDGAVVVGGSIVTPEYFGLLGMTLVRGRLFTDADDERSPGVAIVNEAMARIYWPGADPLGQRIKTSRRATSWTTVVGIVADARTETIDGVPEPHVFADLYQVGDKHLAF